MMFLLISIFEISRGMWMYHTLAHAVKEGTRFAIVHGNNCNIFPNSCASTIRDIATRINWAGTGIVPSEMENVRFESTTRTIVCPTLAGCLDAGALGDTCWPAACPGQPADAGGNRGAQIQISAEFMFHSAIAMFWPGAGGGMNYPAFRLPALSSESIQY